MPRPDADAMVVVLRGDAELARWPLDRDTADLEVVDGLARLQLAANRLGYTIQLRGAPDDLRALLRFTGLAPVVGLIDEGGQSSR